MRGLAILFILVLIMMNIAGGASSEPLENIIIEDYQVRVIRDANIKLTGSIIIKKGAILYISYSNLNFIGDRWKSRITMEEGSTLKIINSRVSSMNEIYFNVTSSKVILNSSVVALKGSMEGKFTLSLSNSTYSISSLHGEGTIYINYSRAIFNGSFEGKIYGIYGYIDGEVYLIGRAEILSGDVKTALGREWFIHRRMSIIVLDKHGMPIEGASVSVINFFNGTLRFSSVTNDKGRVEFVLLADYISPEYHFLGVYNVTVNYRGKIYYKTESLPHYVPGKISEISKIIDFYIDIMAIPISPSNDDFVIIGKSYKISNGSYHYPKRIYLLDEAVLLIENAEIFMNESCIILKNNSKIISKNSKIFSMMYVENSIIELISSEIYKNIYIINGLVSSENSRLHGVYGSGSCEFLNSSANNVQVDNINVFGGCLLNVVVENINGTHCAINYLYVNRTANLYSVSYASLNFNAGAQIYIGYRLEVEVLDKRNRAVENASVLVYNVSDSSLIYTGRSNKSGKVCIYLYSATYKYNEWRYDGNYRVVVSYKNRSIERNVFLKEDTNICIKFEEYLVSPLQLILDINVPQRIESGSVVKIRGWTYYENGMKASDVNIRIILGNIVVSTFTRSDGYFEVSIPVALPQGKYIINIVANDTKYEYLGTSKVVEIEIIPSYTPIYIISPIVVVSVVYIVVRTLKKRRLMSYGEKLSFEGI